MVEDADAAFIQPKSCGIVLVKKRNIIAFVLIAIWLLAATAALRAELSVVIYSPAFFGMDYNDKKAMVGGDIYYLGDKADSIIPASSSSLFVNLSNEGSTYYTSLMLIYHMAPRSIVEVRSLDALAAVRLSDYDYVLFYSFDLEDAFAFNWSYRDQLNSLYSNKTDSGLYALYRVKEGGTD